MSKVNVSAWGVRERTTSFAIAEPTEVHIKGTVRGHTAAFTSNDGYFQLYHQETNAIIMNISSPSSHRPVNIDERRVLYPGFYAMKAGSSGGAYAGASVTITWDPPAVTPATPAQPVKLTSQETSESKIPSVLIIGAGLLTGIGAALSLFGLKK